MTVGSVFYTFPFLTWCKGSVFHWIIVNNSRRFVFYLKLIEFASFKSLSPRHIYKSCFFLWQTGICIQNLAFCIVFCMYFAITFFLISILFCLPWLHRRVRYPPRPIDRLFWLLRCHAVSAFFKPLSKSVDKKTDTECLDFDKHLVLASVVIFIINCHEYWVS